MRTAHYFFRLNTIHSTYTKTFKNTLHTFIIWRILWRVKLIYSKTAAVYFSTNLSYLKCIMINNATIAWIDPIKYLEVTQDRKTHLDQAHS